MYKTAKVDSLGRVHIPKQLREKVNITEGSKIYMINEDNKIIITAEALNQKCPVCSNEFTSEYQFCPYCGQYLITKED